jgi:hypothetical protein
MSAELRSNFLRTQIQNDLAEGRASKVVTRFPLSPMAFFISVTRNLSPSILDWPAVWWALPPAV